MSKVIEITENQYNAIVNGFDLIENKSIIDEALHYLKFLDKVKFETEVTVCDYVSDMIKNNENYLEKEFNYGVVQLYCDELTEIYTKKQLYFSPLITFNNFYTFKYSMVLN